jgi:hypothetical protein
MSYLDINYKKISESIKLLTLPCKEQKNYFPEFVDYSFEIVDSYHNAFLLLPELIENNYFSYLSIASLIRLNNFIDFAISNSAFYELDEEQLEKNDQWLNIQRLARESLERMGEPLEKPDKSYI